LKEEKVGRGEMEATQDEKGGVEHGSREEKAG